MTFNRLTVGALAAVIFSLVVSVPNNLVRLTSVALAQERIPAAEVVWQHVGRIYLNPDTGKAVYAGCVVHLDGVNSSLFNRSPSEATAYFTFSTDVFTLTPMPNDGDVALDLVSAGTFSVYYNSSPNGDWSNPATFSSGKLIAIFSRKKACSPYLDPSHFTAFQKLFCPARASPSMDELSTSMHYPRRDHVRSILQYDAANWNYRLPSWTCRRRHHHGGWRQPVRTLDRRRNQRMAAGRCGSAYPHPLRCVEGLEVSWTGRWRSNYVPHGVPQTAFFHHSICIGCLEVPGKRCSQESDSK